MPSSSEDARQKGNELYTAGKITECESTTKLLSSCEKLTVAGLTFYEQASKLDPEDPSPWSNLSAAHYELGDYAASIAACDSALDLLGPAPDGQDRDAHTIQHRLLLRKAKAYHLATQYDCALAVLQENLEAFKNEKAFAESTQLYADTKVQVTDLNRAYNAIVLDLPRYKPNL